MHQDRQLAAIMFTDIVGYSSIMENDESEALYILEINRQIIQVALSQHGGNCIKEIGDGTLSTFHSTVDALVCATKILKLITEYPKLNLRIALHLGDIIQEDKDIFGDGVNITARLEPLAPCNGIAISQHFYAQIQGKTSYHFKSIGFPNLKNINSKIEVFTWLPSYGNENSISSVNYLSKIDLPALQTAAVILLLVIGIFFAWQQKELKQNIEDNAAISQENIHESSIAVLKFENIGEPLQNQYFNDGLSEELLNLLARIKELRVASRTSTWALPANVTSAMVREQLNVNYMVEGSVRKSADKIRITVQLIDTKTGFHLWSETYDRRLDDALSIQDEIALKITSSLKLLLSAQSLKAVSANKPINAIAFEHYLKAKQFLRQPKTKPSLTNAISFFNQALDIENDFELAHAGLCQSNIEYYKLTFDNGDFKKAEEKCLIILHSNSYQSDIYNSLGNLYLLSGNTAEAEINFQAALTLNLGSVDALIGLARTYNQLSDHSLTNQYFERAIQISPNNSESHEIYGSYLFYQGENKKAIQEFKRVISLTPNYSGAYNSLGAVYFADGDIERGMDVFKRSIEIRENQEAYSNLGTAFFIKKDFTQAIVMYSKAIKLSPEEYQYWGFLAETYEQIPNEKENMLHAYQQAINLAKQMLLVNESNDEIWVSLALYYAKTNEQQKAYRLLKELNSKKLRFDLLYTMSISYLSLENKELALVTLGKAIEKGYDKELIREDESFSMLADHPKFKELLSQ